MQILQQLPLTVRLIRWITIIIISVGYRVKSQRGVQFRIWATGILKEYMRKGFALDDERLKNLGGGGYFKELLERIRDIRSVFQESPK